MKFFELSNFCCCANLKTGGLIIGYLSLAIDIISITFLGLHWMYCIPDLFVTIPMLYGIHKNHPGWMTPAVVLSILSVFLFLLYVIVLMPLGGFVFWRETERYIDRIDDWYGIHVYFKSPHQFFYIFWIFLAVVLVIQWYFTSVLCSLQKSIRNERKTNARYNLTVGQV